MGHYGNSAYFQWFMGIYSGELLGTSIGKFERNICAVVRVSTAGSRESLNQAGIWCQAAR